MSKTVYMFVEDGDIDDENKHSFVSFSLPNLKKTIKARYLKRFKRTYKDCQFNLDGSEILLYPRRAGHPVVEQYSKGVDGDIWGWIREIEVV